ncbi:uncharacterized protein PgNI_04441 [Pyricularia grisea]|uniref:Uncharacterized protein n=1 Tax=Pyricularia grisea TaxID=148305 RepID=A0A6P8BAL4_PYRGI|nr:uncharacterized protein PgNI_04441 [Pyricularia grisea]TLD12865.1 hypothetical protein PgNI_04441 [Pyricularia grisea]
MSFPARFSFTRQQLFSTYFLLQGSKACSKGQKNKKLQARFSTYDDLGPRTWYPECNDEGWYACPHQEYEEVRGYSSGTDDEWAYIRSGPPPKPQSKT